MAQRDLITKGDKNEAFNPDSEHYKMLIKELIRLDIPILEIGSSSIGKSYSIRQFAEEAGVASEFLFVGTEKSEFIEGIPNLKGVTGDTAKFTYLKPYWFPDKDCIRARLINGRNELYSLANNNNTILNLLNKAFVGGGDYKFVDQLKEALLEIKKTDEQIKEAKENKEKSKVCADVVSKFIYADSLLYISTIQGYGNFWLILDEIDKVEKQDKDKYAPLLHIVRERELKGWKLSGLRSYPEYDIKFVTTVALRKERLDAALENPSVDVTDTRIIAIANDLQVMEVESPALYRRFVKIVIERSLYNEKTVKLPSGDPTKPVGYDWAAQYEVTKQDFHTCIVNKDVSSGEPTGSGLKRSGVATGKKKGVTIGEQMAFIQEELKGFRLKEMNLQWTLGFFPEILFPGTDTRKQGESFVPNLLVEDFNDQNNPYQTLLFKIISDNFDTEYWAALLQCIYDKVSVKQTEPSKEVAMKSDVDDFFAEAGLSIDKFDSPDPKDVETYITDKYQKKLNFVNGKFKESVEAQLNASSSTQMAGLEGGVAKIAVDAIVLGNQLIEKSLINNKPTVLTRMLVSSIPFIQTKFICHSPYIPYNGAMDLVEVQDSGMVNLITTITGKNFDSESLALTAAKEVFTLIEPYKPFIVRYAVGVPSNLVDSVVEGNYGAITDSKATLEEIIANGPVIIDNNILNLTSPVKDVPLRLRYFNSLANIKLIEKEVYTNLPGTIWIMITNTFESQQGLTDDVKKSIDYYAERFPNAIINLAGSPNTPEEVKDYAITKANDVKSNSGNYMISEIDKIRD
jgi:hypothetical protein